MIDGNKYTKIVKAYFNFLINEFGFRVYKEKVSGNAFYDVQYNNEVQIVSISYENIGDYLLVIVFLLQNGELPDYDDKTKTLHLNKLNASVLPKVKKYEIDSNNKYFSRFDPKDDLEKKLLKSAKELRLCLAHSSAYT